MSKKSIPLSDKVDFDVLGLIRYKPDEQTGVPKIRKKNKSQKPFYNALDIVNLKIDILPKLLVPLLQTIGLASIVGTSDVGKSTLLRQLSLHLVLKIDEFLGFQLKGNAHSVIYVSTEDDISSISYCLRKQLKFLKEKYPTIDESLLENLFFLFETDNLLLKLEKRIEKNPVDLIIIDAFSDVFTKEINANTQVRKFLNSYDRLAKKYNCLILFLHHTGKRTQHYAPTKDSIIGSQGFEAKMRAVIELRPSKIKNQRELWVLKANFLNSKYKEEASILSFNESLIFENTGEVARKVASKKGNPLIIKKVFELHKKGLSTRNIESELKDTKLAVSKSVVNQILKKLKE